LYYFIKLIEFTLYQYTMSSSNEQLETVQLKFGSIQGKDLKKFISNIIQSYISNIK